MSSVNGSIAILDQVLFIIKIPDYYWSQIIFLDVNALFPKMLMLHAFYSTQNSNTAITNNEVWIIFFRCLYAKYKHSCLHQTQYDFRWKISLFFNIRLSDFFTGRQAFCNLLPKLPLSFSLTYVYILVSAEPFPKFSY